MTTILLLVIYIIFISLGLPDSLLGAAWPVAHLALGVPVSLAGVTSMFITAGTVVSSLVAVSVVRRLGAGRVTAISILLTAIALLGYSFADRYIAICLFAIPLGLGAGSIDAVLNNYVATHYNRVQMNLLHAFWGVGATCGPLIMAAFLARGGDWHGGYRMVSFIQFGIAALALMSLPLWRRVGLAEQSKAGGEAEPIAGNIEALRAPGVRLGMLAFFFYCTAEMGTGLWAATYYVSVKGVSPEVAAGYGSLFFAGIMAGRVASGFASVKLSEGQLIRIGVIVAFIGAVCMLALPMPSAVAGVLLVGLGCAPIFPNMLQLTPQRFGVRVSQAAIGLQMAASYVGSSITPPLFGLIGERFGFALLPYFVLLCMAGVAAVNFRLRRYRAGAVQQASARSEEART